MPSPFLAHGQSRVACTCAPRGRSVLLDSRWVNWGPCVWSVGKHAPVMDASFPAVQPSNRQTVSVQLVSVSRTRTGLGGVLLCFGVHVTSLVPQLAHPANRKQRQSPAKPMKGPSSQRLFSQLS